MIGVLMTRCGLYILIAGFALIGVDALAFSFCLRRQPMVRLVGIAAIGAGAVLMSVGMR